MGCSAPSARTVSSARCVAAGSWSAPSSWRRTAPVRSTPRRWRSSTARRGTAARSSTRAARSCVWHRRSASRARRSTSSSTSSRPASRSWRPRSSPETPMLRRGRRLALTTALIALAATASAQEPPPAAPTPSAPLPETLPPVVVTAPPPIASSSEQLIPDKDFELRPQGRPADVLRLVPGLIINQHQGGGKAEQYLIRGFDADHGTDLAIFVDGLPVNLRSHAHGQGYADLHFLIPETVKLVDVLKGPYFPEYGDFATAAVVQFVTRDVVEENTLSIAGGSFNTERYLALLSPTRDVVKTLVAVEVYRSDGPFDHPNGYLRLHAFAKA